MQGVERDLHEWRSFSTSEEIAKVVINVASQVTPDVNIYVALLSKGGDRMTYVACSAKSNMTGKILHDGEGVSFTVVDNQVVRRKLFVYLS